MKDPLEYMVEDCWRHLFQFIPAKDKQALCDTCETFRAMLQPEKTKWGLELILPHILKELSSGFGYYEKLKSVLELRQVCKSWRAGFDKYCGNVEYKPGGFYPHVFEDILMKYNFQNVPELENFLAFFKSYGANPFIGRRVSIYAVSSEADEPENQGENSEAELDYESDVASEESGMDEEEDENEDEDGSEEDEEEENEEDEEEENEEEEDENEESENEEDEEYEVEQVFLQGLNAAIDILRPYTERFEREARENALKSRKLLLEMLPKFGKEIDHLYFSMMGECPRLDAHKFLHTVLSNCPNLQSLEADFFDVLSFEEREDDSLEFQKRLADYFEMNPLPNIPLSKLTLRGVNFQVEKLLLEAVGQNLRIFEKGDFTEIPLSVWGSMKSLQTLKLYNYSFEQIETLLQAIQSPLETLTLARDSCDRRPSEFFKIDKFLLAVQHLPLKQVSIHPDSGILKESAPFPDDFPKHQSIVKFSILRCQLYSPNLVQFLPNLQSFFVNGAKCPMKLYSKK